jgi:CheY-like chemotaxis protein
MAKRILIVDDEADLVDILSARLLHEGYDVDEAQNGREGLGAFVAALVQGRPYDLILLDIRMPGLTGIEVLEALRKEEELRGIVLGSGAIVIMLTAMQNPVFDSFKQGCDDFVLKPYDEATLIKKIQQKFANKDQLN